MNRHRCNTSRVLEVTKGHRMGTEFGLNEVRSGYLPESANEKFTADSSGSELDGGPSMILINIG